MAGPATAVTAVIQGQLLSWLVGAPSKPISRSSHQCPVGGIWHFPQHDYNAPFVDDELLFEKFAEELEAEEDDSRFPWQTHTNKMRRSKNRENYQRSRNRNHYLRHRQEDEVNPKDEKQHSTLIIQPRESEKQENKWTYAINLFLHGSTYYALHTSSSDSATYIALNLHKAQAKDDTPDFASMFGLISCVNIDGRNRLFVVIVPRKNNDKFPKFLEFFRVAKDVDMLPGTVEEQLAAAKQLVNSTKTFPGEGMDEVLPKELQQSGNKVQKVKQFMEAASSSTSQKSQHQTPPAAKSLLDSKAEQEQMLLSSQNDAHKDTSSPGFDEKEGKMNKSIHKSKDKTMNKKQTGNAKSLSHKFPSKDMHALSTNSPVLAPTVNTSLSKSQAVGQSCNGSNSHTNKAHVCAQDYLESPESDDKPQVKVYQSKSDPNTTITKIKEKPLADGSTKKKTIQDIKLQDGKKTKTKTVIKTPDGGEKIKKKTLVTTPNKNATKTDEVKIGKNFKSQKTKLNEVKITPTGSKQKNSVQKIKESPGKKKFTLEEQKQFVGPNEKKFEKKKEKEESSQKESENESEQKQESVQESSSYIESTDGADLDENKKQKPFKRKTLGQSPSEYSSNKPSNVSVEQIDRKKHHRPKGIHHHTTIDANTVSSPAASSAHQEAVKTPRTQVQEVVNKKNQESSSEVTSSKIMTDTLPPSKHESPKRFIANFTEKVGKPVKNLFGSLLHPSRKKVNVAQQARSHKNSTDFLENPSAPQNVVFETNATTSHREPSSGKSEKVGNEGMRHDGGHVASAERRYLAQLESCDDEGSNSKACREKRRQRRRGSNW